MNGKQSKMPKRADRLIAELEALESVEQRIDCVARDFATGKNKYGLIDARTLGELLGLDFHDTADWYRTFWAYKCRLEDETSFTHPFAENVGLLQGEISDDRYQKLATLAADITSKDRRRDLPLTKEEKAILRDAYAESQEVDSSNLTVAETTVTSSDGVGLDFQVCIGDAGEPFDPQSPYDLKKGKGFTSDEYIEVF
jgi:hypothetical protein